MILVIEGENAVKRRYGSERVREVGGGEDSYPVNAVFIII